MMHAPESCATGPCSCECPACQVAPPHPDHVSPEPAPVDRRVDLADDVAPITEAELRALWGDR